MLTKEIFTTIGIRIPKPEVRVESLDEVLADLDFAEQQWGRCPANAHTDRSLVRLRRHLEFGRIHIPLRPVKLQRDMDSQIPIDVFETQ